MRVRDCMSTDLVTVSSRTSIADARRLMITHGVRRLPVIDKGKLVGIVTDRKVAEASPSAATTLSIWEMNYLLAKMTVAEIMKKQVVTTTPDTTVESAVALAQEEKVGALPVLENGHLVGMVTTNDFFYRVLNPLLGIGQPGVRLHIRDCGTAQRIEEAVRFINKHDLEIVAIHIDAPSQQLEKDLIVQLDTEDASALMADLKQRGYTTYIRPR